MMQLTNKTSNKIQASYTLEAVGLDSEKRIFSEKMRKERKKRRTNRAQMQNLCRMGI